MKRCGSIFALFLMFFAVSCDNGLKFNNPNDKNSDAYRGGDADSEGTDDDAERPAGREQGELYGECYPNKTCNEGLECDVLNNICKKDAGDSGDTEPTDTGDTEPTDTGDTEPTDTGTEDPADTGDTTPPDTGDTTEPTDTGDTTDPTDTGDTEPTDTGDTTPTEEEICAEAGGTYDYFAEDELTKCYKIVECDPKPANTEWRGEQSYTEYYDLDEGYWTHFGLNYSTEYGDTGEAKVCQYICAPGFDWTGYACTSSGPSTLPECSPTSSTPCRDSSSGFIWSARASSWMTWSNAVSYCDNLTEGGYSDWHLPNIDELRTLLIANRVTSNCQVSEANNCLSSSCWSCSTCTQTGTQSSSGTDCSDWGSSYSDGRYSKFGETGLFWSSSTGVNFTSYAWYVDFSSGYVYSSYTPNGNYVRCVR